MVYFIMLRSEFCKKGISTKNELQIWFIPLIKKEDMLNLSSTFTPT